VPIPTPGATDDPSLSGMVITLIGRGSHTTATLTAPPGVSRPGWSVRSAPRVSYAYAAPGLAPGSASPIHVTLRTGSGLRIRAKSSGLVLAAPEGAVAVRIELGPTRVCALFDAPAVRRDQAGRFVARDADAAGLADCNDGTLSASPCGGTAPACDGECPSGEACGSLGGFPEPSCGCLPAGSTPCGTVYPSCGDGDCPAGTSCFADAFTCCGDVVIPYCACLSEPPPEPCPGGCPPGWICTLPAPGFQPFCLPPFCSGGSAPACDGSCGSQPGTACTAVGNLCFCLTPCSGGDPYPTCGGTCVEAGWTCSGVEGSCICLPPS
jgi:hypothetical protein